MNAKNENVTYSVITQEDDNGDLLIPIPPQIKKKLGWGIDDAIEISIDDKGRYIFTKVTHE